MFIDSTFVSLFTNPYVATAISLCLASLSCIIYGSLFTRTNFRYSRFLRWYEKNNLGPDFGIVTAILGLVSVVVIVVNIGVHENHKGIGLGIVSYGILLLFLSIFFTKADIMEKRDLKAVHKRQVKSLKEVIKLNIAQVAEYEKYDGKTKIKVNRVIAQLKELELNVQSEGKIRKNKEGILPSLERLTEIESEKKTIQQSFLRIQDEIEKIYDFYYQLESHLLQKRHEDAKKQLNVAKELIEKDPFASLSILNKIQEKEEMY